MEERHPSTTFLTWNYLLWVCVSVQFWQACGFCPQTKLYTVKSAQFSLWTFSFQCGKEPPVGKWGKWSKRHRFDITQLPVSLRQTDSLRLCWHYSSLNKTPNWINSGTHCFWQTRQHSYCFLIAVSKISWQLFLEAVSCRVNSGYPNLWNVSEKQKLQRGAGHFLLFF